MTAVARAPEFSLRSVAGPPVRLADLYGGGSALLLFVSEECPTSVLTLRRLAPVVSELSAAGVRVAAVFEDPLEVAARVARRTEFAGLVLSEPAPYEVSQAYSLASLPTAVLVDRSGVEVGRVVGWDAAGLRTLLSVPITDEPPLRKPGCAAKNTYDPEELRLLDGGHFSDLEDMFDRGWSDGLPVIPPTSDRVEAMLGGRDRDLLLGEMAPSLARVTLERVAACAVLAGCRPDYFPVVVAAVEAVLEPAFNVGGQAVTTQPCGQVIVVNGPVRDAIGLNGSVGALGPGWRPNMTIGRALRLVVSLTGGGFPGRLDRSTLGNPGKIAMCFAEDEEVSPWEPLHVSRGFVSVVVRGYGGRRGCSAVDLGPPEHWSSRARAGAGRCCGRDLESELVAARWGLAVRDLSRARAVVLRVGVVEGARARGDVLRGRSARRGRCAGERPRRWSTRPRTMSSSVSGTARTTSCSSSPAARPAATRRCSGRASG